METPILRKAARCKSIGRLPIAQPPGYAILPAPLLPSIAPRKRMEERIFRTASPQSAAACISRLSITAVRSVSVTEQPSSLRISKVCETSRICGRFSRTTSSAASTHAARMGKAAFLLPAPQILPLSASRPAPDMSPWRSLQKFLYPHAIGREPIRCVFYIYKKEKNS